MWTILKLLGGIQPNYWGDISPHPPLVSAPLQSAFSFESRFASNFLSPINFQISGPINIPTFNIVSLLLGNLCLKYKMPLPIESIAFTKLLNEPSLKCSGGRYIFYGSTKGMC